jgi:hypothetical protein
MAPLVIGVFFFSSVQLFFIGIIGEYLGRLYLEAKGRPLYVIDQVVSLRTQVTYPK